MQNLGLTNNYFQKLKAKLLKKRLTLFFIFDVQHLRCNLLHYETPSSILFLKLSTMSLVLSSESDFSTLLYACITVE